jgi:uncharacterized protein YdiU (UPF0061 family)
VFSSIDHGGRYAYGNQPVIVQWNLARFAEALLPLLDSDREKAVARATEALGDYPALFEGYWLGGMRSKLGLQTDEAGDVELVRSLLAWMERSRADFTNTFRDLSAEGPSASERYQDEDFQVWYSRWQDRLGRDGRTKASAHALMRSVNPVVVPRNHRVEEALAAAEDRDDLSVLHRLLEVLASPYQGRANLAPYQDLPADDCNYRTFCGT